MKRLAALTAAVCLLGATAPANYNAFGFALLQRLAAQAHNANVFISPVSLGIALAMAADGAAGGTRTQMLHVLGANGADLAQENAALVASLASNHDATLGIANALWLRNDLPPRPAYVALLRREYDAQAQALHFGDPSAAATINAWTKAHTLGLIPQLVSQTKASDVLYLTNALAFQATWTVPFSANETSSRPFTESDGTTHTVPMMGRVGQFEIAQSPTFQILRLPYGAGGFAAYVLLPTGRNADSLAAQLTPATFDAARAALHSTFVGLEMPRFTAEYSQDASALLQALGMRLAFSPRDADFLPMHAPPPPIFIGAVLHRTYVRVDERGTTAAAASAVTMVGAALVRATPFIVNRPFVFAIRDERSGAILFIGVINRV